MILKSLISLSLLAVGTVHGNVVRRATALTAEINEPWHYDSPIGQFPAQVRPHINSHPHHHDEEATGTIYETLAKNPKFSKVTKALDFVEDIATLLNSTDAKLTFFAPPDEALRRPKRHEDRHARWASVIAYEDDAAGMSANRFSEDLPGALDLLEDLDHPSWPSDPKKRKAILKVIIRALLKYHIIPEDGYDSAQLGRNTTYATGLKVSALFDAQPFRLRVEQKAILPLTTINFYARIIHPNIKATNGFIHAINHPLLPPPTIFQELFFIPQVFSIFTSTLQRSNLTLGTDLSWSKETGLVGARVATVFAPINRAFERLPKKLQFFLFSPFGAHVLKKLLQYHIVPETALFSDYSHTRKVEKQAIDFENHQVEEPHRCHGKRDTSFKSWVLNRIGLGHKRGPVKVEPIFNKNATLETAFFNHSVNAFILQNKITLPFHPHHPLIDTKIFVNHQHVHVRDIVAANGAIHVIDRLLDPRKPHGSPPPGSPPHRRGPHHGHEHHRGPHHDHEHHRGPPHHGHHKHGHNFETEGDHYDLIWEDWEEWLPQWAEEN
ncbi:FAS1 domain-containing protein [Crepidotus variabilis]|uniref:FAS1 domain-containing protein n=1 Tax=Crepidotus variabilis TaxID=179855 RepID=A0A9P6EM75_9AGAR|nr:FAS1 domain-containing protein [Crepidotus variabilis]